MITERFIVCGLGSLGQHCVVALKEFGVSIIAIEQVKPPNWEIANLENLVDELILGDCRQNNILERARIECCRSVLIVTSNDRVNIETALAVRQLNPQTRLVVSSAKTNLNQLLSEQLGNFIAYEPTQLPATAFALAAIGTETLGFFHLDARSLRVIKREISKEDRWCGSRLVCDLDSHSRRVIGFGRNGDRFSVSFHDWEQEQLILPGDTLVYIETTDPFFLQSERQSKLYFQQQKRFLWPKAIGRFVNNFKQFFTKFWQSNFQQQVKQVALFCAIISLVLLLVGTALFYWYYPGITFLAALSATIILLLGGYGDLFGNLEQTLSLPWWLQLLGLGITLAGTAFVGVLYALLTEALLSSKFQFVRLRQPVPQQDHVVIVGLDRIGQCVVSLLEEFKQPVVGISDNLDFDPTILPQMPLVVDNFKDALTKVNLATAKSLLVLTDDEILNLEVALMARSINPRTHLVLRALGEHLSKHLTQLLPDAQILGAYAVAAEAFAGAAFGENILNLFRLGDRTILVTEYRIENGDTLNGLLLSEVAFGYDVVPILHQQPLKDSILMPSEDIRLAIGDRLVILATSEGLQQVEGGKINTSAKYYLVRVEKALLPEAVFEGANAIARISGCSLSMARNLMNNLPQTLPVPLYKQQARRLVRELKLALVKAQIVLD
jgi:Trk K+ transport system NAD-binding subunit